MSDITAGFSGAPGDKSDGASDATKTELKRYHAFNPRVTLSLQEDDIDRPGINGMSLLHLAIGHHDTDLIDGLIKRGAKFYPDDNGRMPSVLAGLVGLGEALREQIADAEAKALGILDPED